MDGGEREEEVEYMCAQTVYNWRCADAACRRLARGLGMNREETKKVRKYYGSSWKGSKGCCYSSPLFRT